VASVRAAAGRGLLYRVRETRPVPFEAGTDHMAWLARSEMARLAKYVAAGYSIPVAFHGDFDGLAGVDVIRFGRLVDSMPWGERPAALAAAGVTAVLSDEPIEAAGLRPAPSPPGLHLYRVDGARPPAWMDGDAEAVVEEHPARPAQRSFRVTASREGTLLLTTPFVEGWSARIDGRAAAVRRANGYMQAVDVPAGRHEVELAYWPPGLSAGAGTAALAAVALGIAVARGRRVSASPA
jgi:hypothetical protein